MTVAYRRLSRWQAAPTPRTGARFAALQVLLKASTNSNERGWLAAGLRDAERRLK